MATLYKQGEETSRWARRGWKSIYSVRSNGKVLRRLSQRWTILVDSDGLPIPASDFLTMVLKPQLGFFELW